MEQFPIDITPGSTAEDTALTVASAKAGLAGDKILAQEVIPTNDQTSAAFFAIRKKPDPAASQVDIIPVHAQLVEWQVVRGKSVHLTFRNEGEPFPDGRLAPLSVLKQLTPTEDPESLKWRDLSRYQLALAGEFDRAAQEAVNRETTADTTHRGHGQTAHGPRHNNSENRTEADSEGPVQELVVSQKPVKKAAELDDQQKAASPQKFRVIIDRAGTVQNSGGAKPFLKLSALMTDGAKKLFVTVIAYGAKAYQLQERLEAEIGKTGTVALEFGGKPGSPGQKPNYNLYSIIGITPTEERIQSRTQSRPETEQTKAETQEPVATLASRARTEPEHAL